jgi:hypothetical protein
MENVHKDNDWFSSLLDNVNISTTKYIEENVANVRFVILSQEIFETHILRRVGFYLNNHMICEATNRVVRNQMIDDWIAQHSNEPFGKIFRNVEMKRELISKTNSERKYSISGKINAEIVEKFFQLPD